MLHFDNAPVRNTEGVQESLATFVFKRIEHPPHSPDLAPYVFILFGSMKQAFAGQHFDTINDVFYRCGGISTDFLQVVFHEWVRQL
jgi:hypothetical protein